MKKECVNIEKELLKLTDKYVRHHKTDITYDINKIKKSKETIFYCYFRENGTNLMPKFLVLAKGSSEYNGALFYKDFEGIYTFKIEVTKRTSNEVLGFVTSINKNDFINSVLLDSKQPVAVKMDIVTKNGKIIEFISYNLEHFKDDAIIRTKIQPNMIEKIEVKEYLFA